MTRRRWIQDRVTGELVPVASRAQRAAPATPAVIGDIEPFKSPIDGRIIGSRRDLRTHQEEHGVVPQGEYGENNGKAYFERQEQARHARRTLTLPQDTQRRREALRAALDRTTRR